MLTLRHSLLSKLFVMTMACGMFVADELQADYMPSPTVYDLECSMVTDKAVYSLGETVYVTQTMYNPHDTPIQINFWATTTPPGFNLWVMSGNDRIYTAYEMWLWWGPANYIVGPGDVLEWDYTWKMIKDNGNLVREGEYELVGVIKEGLGDIAVASTNITVTHAPEPGTLGLMVLGTLGLLGRRKKRRHGKYGNRRTC